MFSCIRTDTGKYGPEKTPYLDTFHVEYKFLFFSESEKIYSEKKQTSCSRLANWGMRKKIKKMENTLSSPILNHLP